MKNITKLTLIMFIVLTVTSCGENNSPSNSATAQTKSKAVVNESKLTKYMQKDTVCNVLSVDGIKKVFNVINDISTRATTNKYISGFSCDYKWTRADAKEREANFMSYTIDQMQGKVEKISMRKRTPESNISIRIDEYKGDAKHFVPTKLSEEQLQSQIADAKKRANDRLTDAQKNIAGSMANNMLENMLRKNNENTIINGIGDVAYWTNVAGGGLNVLSGNTKLFISLMIGESMEEDIKNAEKVAQLILN